MSIDILHRDELKRGGFAGLREHRLVMDPRAWGPRTNPGTWPGLGSCVYLADARFLPHGETGLHPHRDIDVISVMVEGRIAHGGSLEDGEMLEAGQVQVQVAGRQGFEHNEVNPDDAENRMLQLWVLPEEPSEEAGYAVYRPERGGGLVRIYGGTRADGAAFPSSTLLDVGLLRAGESFRLEGPFLLYVSQGEGTIEGQTIRDGHLVRSESTEFRAATDAQVVVISG